MSPTTVRELAGGYVEMTAQAGSLPLPAARSADGTTLKPHHALIQVEGGDIRYRLDGTDPIDPFAILARDGESIDWTNPDYDYQSFIELFRGVATRVADGYSTIILNISWRE